MDTQKSSAQYDVCDNFPCFLLATLIIKSHTVQCKINDCILNVNIQLRKLWVMIFELYEVK